MEVLVGTFVGVFVGISVGVLVGIFVVVLETGAGVVECNVIVVVGLMTTVDVLCAPSVVVPDDISPVIPERSAVVVDALNESIVVGAAVGAAVGAPVGPAVTAGVGASVGPAVTAGVGASVGAAVGAAVDIAFVVVVASSVVDEDWADIDAAKSFKNS